MPKLLGSSKYFVVITFSGTKVDCDNYPTHGKASLIPLTCDHESDKTKPSQ